MARWDAHRASAANMSLRTSLNGLSRLRRVNTTRDAITTAIAIALNSGFDDHHGDDTSDRNRRTATTRGKRNVGRNVGRARVISRNTTTLIVP